MIRKIALVFVLVALFVSCKGGEDEENDGNKAWEQLVGNTQLETAEEFTIMGTVKCTKCRPYDLLWVEVKNPGDTDYYANIWKGQFGEGKFKITAYMFPEKDFLLRVAEGAMAANGVSKTYTAPEDPATPIEIVFDLDAY